MWKCHYYCVNVRYHKYHCGFQTTVLNLIWAVFAPEALQESWFWSKALARATSAVTVYTLILFTYGSLEKFWFFMEQASYQAQEKGRGIFWTFLLNFVFWSTFRLAVPPRSVCVTRQVKKTYGKLFNSLLLEACSLLFLYFKQRSASSQ